MKKYNFKMLKPFITSLIFCAALSFCKVSFLIAAPVVDITSELPPADSYQVELGDNILFYGEVELDEGATVPSDGYHWISSIDGELNPTGQQSILNTSVITSMGTHTIQFYVVDSNDDVSNITTIELVVGTPPVVHITSPANDSSYSYGAYITFSVTATTSANTPVPNRNLIWESNKDGYLGYGTSIPLNDLSVNTHEITVTATDDYGFSNTAKVTVTIGNAMPDVLITSPADGGSHSYGSTIFFTAAITDEEDGPLTGNSVVWSSNIDGFMGYGPSITKDDLSVGTHTVTVTATDSSDASTEVFITIIVGNASPVVVIRTPSNNVSISYGSVVTFTANVTDAEDGVLTGKSVVWTSDRDGFVGEGTALTKSGLSAGTHIITATGTDSSGLEGEAFITVNITNTSPSILIMSPADNSSFSHGSVITFMASVTDIEDGVITGKNVQWKSDRDGFLGEGTALTKSTLSVGTHVITVTATDKTALVSTESITITVGNASPVILIRSPADNSSIDYGETITFLAAVTDAEDGDITGKSIIWESDRDGFFGYDTSLTINNLSVGTHVITVTATDSTDLVTTATITVTIKDSSPVTVEIVKPADGDHFNFSEPIEFEGTATDSEDGELTGSSLVWASNQLSTSIGTGNRISVSTLAMGTHLITLTATDSSGNVARAFVSIVIEGALPPEVEITAPSDGTSFYLNEYIEFVGSATDNEDGVLTGESLVWTSNLEKTSIGTGEIFKINTLSAGKHLITLTATDSDGTKGIDFILVTVANTPPEPVITSPDNQSEFDDGEVIRFAGYATDDEDGNLTGTSLSWVSDVDGFIGSGVNFSTSLSEGEHTISLIAKDSHGDEVKTTINLTINHTEQSDPMQLGEQYVSVPLDQVAYFSISGGHPPYRYYRDYPHIATMDIVAQTDGNGYRLRVLAEEMGETTFQVMDHYNTTRVLHLTVTDSADNIPFADAGADQTVVEGTTVTLDGSASLPGVYGIASWKWQQIDDDKNNLVVLSDSAVKKVTFVAPPADEISVLTFRLTVTDTNGSVSDDDVTVNVLTNGIDEYPSGVIAFETADSANSLGVALAGDGDYVAIDPLYPQFIKEDAGRPENMTYGLVDLKIKVEPGENAFMLVYFPEPMPEDYGVYKYSYSTGWYEYSDNVTFSSDRTRLYVILTDGGSGDDDAALDGIISDPIAFGTTPEISSDPDPEPEEPVTPPEDEGGDGGGGGCFISTIFN
ncbi:exported hypothetical protein [Desulfamplus magnetovallimortis]|uniref:PKD/Chitinase domain-containing protein n=1 Tax=Desulfamplus magnetovallimortis TaxID=1246637 RepID=A0A1W1H9V7_9BACT|nr:choice-of-anchor U domain-containing protein [Desulfamplus magnetovallimortis]SLM29233.1 exported hypothetical protein [Desulfamplus magnetovallimortis]